MGRYGRPVRLGLPAAAISAVCYGVASVFQAQAARRAEASDRVDPRLLIRMATQLPYLLSICLDLGGFAFGVLALRTLPLYVVQSITSANLAVTALLVAAVYRVRLAAREWVAVVTICVGLALLGLSSGREGSNGGVVVVRIGLLAGAFVLGVVAIALARTDRPVPSIVLGAVAGLGFGTVALAARTLPTLDPLHLAADPAAYAMAIGALVGALFFATALQRGRVTTVTAAVVVGETVVPAVIGIVALGDRVRPEAAPLVAAGFVLSVGAVLSLARFGDVAMTRERQSSV